MTKRKEADENETATVVEQKSIAPADKQATSAANASRAADAQQKAADELHAIAQRLNKLQHDDYIVPVANALKFVDQAIQALHQQPDQVAGEQPAQPAQDTGNVVNL